MTGSGVKAWTALALLGALAAAVVAADLATNGYEASALEDIAYVTLVAVVAGVGFLLVRRVPDNVIGWLLLAQAFALVLGALAEEWGAYGLDHAGPEPGSRLGAIWDTQGWPSIFAPLVAIVFLFPDGRLPSTRWRPVAVGGIIAFAVTIAGGLLGPEVLDSPFESVEPYSVLPKGLAEAMLGLGLLAMIVTFVLAVVAMRSRFIGADIVGRAQLKWLFYASALVPLAIVLGTIDGIVFDGDGDGPLTTIPFVAATAAIPLAIGVAVTRYRLYEIDRLISATVLYVTLTLLLASAFVVVILFGGVAVGGGSPVTTAAATLAVTVAFRPLRAALQTRVDRRFNRTRYESLRAIDEFLIALRSGEAEPEGLEGVLASAVHDSGLRLLFWLPGEDAHVDASGALTPLPSSPAGRTPVTRGDLQLGTVLHDPGLSQGALDEVIVRAGLAIEVARLRVEVRRQLAEVEASRARIASATHEERRRLERDLHDGAQQRLVSIGLDLRHLQQGLSPKDTAHTGLDDAVGGLADAIGELRELARGVRPGMLDDGLARALTDLASRSPMRIEVDVTRERFSDEIEAAAYFVASEALANTAKHSGGRSVVVKARREGDLLRLVVRDDGQGGATSANGSGLTGLADRVAALGGGFSVKSPPGGGTELRAEFPCA